MAPDPIPIRPATPTRTTAAIASAFTTTPISLALYAERHDLAPPYPTALPSSALTPYFLPQIADAVHSGAELVEAGDYSAVAAWGIPTPCLSPPPPPPQGQEEQQSPPPRQLPLLNEYLTQVSAAKRRHLPDPQCHPPHYDLKFLARNPSVPRVAGAVSAVVRPYLVRARGEGRSVWLEATSPAAVGVYEHWGFRVVEEMVIGRGKVGADGWPVREGGEGQGQGLRVWGMVFV
ncbi:hypothetical protein B0J12DRAFT_146438 [Macrophomina phaseolina]|uniref:N-acetyltransferase domain-containing protein n=1 Tax=Macrophomina phaseolina TaxID=35725 RepID=A0ABQ8G649_9PEZI|nr:hypothetical protein B0J12DRAFT_146438 [Macrophomina phaseolina]